MTANPDDSPTLCTVFTLLSLPELQWERNLFLNKGSIESDTGTISIPFYHVVRSPVKNLSGHNALSLEGANNFRFLFTYFKTYRGKVSQWSNKILEADENVFLPSFRLSLSATTVYTVSLGKCGFYNDKLRNKGKLQDRKAPIASDPTT